MSSTENKHAENCPFENENLAYALLEINDTTMILVSAEEMTNYNKYLKSARNNDADINIDFDTCDNEPYQIVYGSILYHERKGEEIIEYVNELKELALINVDGEFGNLIASAYDDIRLFTDESIRNESIPFAALIKTKCEENPYSPVTLFPCCDRTVFENIINRSFLLACRKFVKIEGLTIENWTEFIDMDTLKEAYRTAEIYTGE